MKERTHSQPSTHNKQAQIELCLGRHPAGLDPEELKSLSHRHELRAEQEQEAGGGKRSMVSDLGVQTCLYLPFHAPGKRINTQTKLFSEGALAVFSQQLECSWVAPCTLMKAERCWNRTDGEVKWECVLVRRQSVPGDCQRH